MTSTRVGISETWLKIKMTVNRTSSGVSRRKQSQHMLKKDSLSSHTTNIDIGALHCWLHKIHDTHGRNHESSMVAAKTLSTISVIEPAMRERISSITKI